jgi:hypothetical protein
MAEQLSYSWIIMDQCHSWIGRYRIRPTYINFNSYRRIPKKIMSDLRYAPPAEEAETQITPVNRHT